MGLPLLLGCWNAVAIESTFHILSIFSLVTNSSKRTAVTTIKQCTHSERHQPAAHFYISDFRFFFHQHFDLICFGCSFTNGFGLTMTIQVELIFAWITRNKHSAYLYDFSVFISSIQSLTLRWTHVCVCRSLVCKSECLTLGLDLIGSSVVWTTCQFWI